LRKFDFSDTSAHYKKYEVARDVFSFP